MSGHKCSEIEWDMDLLERLALVRRITQDHNALLGLAAHLRDTLARTSTGLQASFPTETRRIQEFLAELSLPDIQALNVDAAKPTLLKVSRDLAAQTQRANLLCEAADTAFGQHANRMAVDLTRQWRETATQFAGNRELLAQWQSPENLADWERKLAEIESQLQQQRFAEAAPALRQGREELIRQVQRAANLAEQHQKRLYVLKAIDSVCLARGFKRIQEPDYENPSDTTSRILVTYDTLDRGQIEFSLGMQGIQAHADSGEKFCFAEFDALSANLQAQFGLKTEFRRASDGSRPNLQTVRGTGQETERRIVAKNQSRRQSL